MLETQKVKLTFGGGWVPFEACARTAGENPPAKDVDEPALLDESVKLTFMPAVESLSADGGTLVLLLNFNPVPKGTAVLAVAEVTPNLNPVFAVEEEVPAAPKLMPLS